MSILNVNTIQPIGSGTTVTVTATELKASNFITVGTGASVTSPSANVLTLGTNAAERFRITSAGLIGIGTVSPSGPIHAYVASGTQRSYLEASAAHSFLRLKSGSTSYNSGIEFFSGASNIANVNGLGAGGLQFEVNGSERLRINSSGNLLLGRNSDYWSSRSIVQEDKNGRAHLLVKNDNNHASASAGITLNAFGNSWAIDCGSHPNNTNSLTFGLDASAGSPAEKLRITSGGDMGLGTASPTARLDVRRGDADGKIAEFHQSSGYGIDIGSSQADAYISSGYNQNFIFKTDPSSGQVERLRIDSSGRVLINTGTDGPITTTSGANLQIRATSEAPRIILGRNDSTATTGESLGILGWFGNDGGSYQECARIAAVVDANHANNDKPTRISFYVCRDNSGSLSESWRLRSDGGTQNFSTSTNYDLSNTRSAGNTYEFIYARNNSGSMGAGTLAFKVTNNGNVSNTNNSYSSLSDQRLKENIVDATSQWDDIKGLQIRKYNFRENTGYETHTQIGLIAQEVESISPGLVETSAVKEGETVLDADGNQLDSIKSINYSVLYMKSVKALQEAQTRIEALETQNADLLARVTALEGS